jgi:hypothetical protein
MPVQFICKECGITFNVPPSRAKKEPQFCSKECKFENWKKRETDNRSFVKCLNCGKEYLLYNCRKATRENYFCSNKCHGEFNNKQTEIPCEECGTLFKVKISRLETQNPRYCSMKCRNKAFRGENSPLYTMQTRKCEWCGKTFHKELNQIKVGKGKFCSKDCWYKSMELERPSDSEHFYGSAFWIRLREQCYERDKFICQKCGKNGELHAHHIVPRVFGGKDILENLISLCPSCHLTTEYETRKQYN